MKGKGREGKGREEKRKRRNVEEKRRETPLISSVFCSACSIGCPAVSDKVPEEKAVELLCPFEAFIASVEFGFTIWNFTAPFDLDHCNYCNPFFFCDALSLLKLRPYQCSTHYTGTSKKLSAGKIRNERSAGKLASGKLPNGATDEKPSKICAKIRRIRKYNTKFRKKFPIGDSLM